MADAVGEAKSYEINCATVVNDNLLSTDDLAKYLEARIKVNGKTGRVSGNVDIVCTGETVIVSPKVGGFPKRYLKYLGNKFLYKKELKDWVRIVADGKKAYKLAYYKVDSNKDE